MNNCCNCKNSFFITSLACYLFETYSIEELEILSSDLVQLADTLAAMTIRQTNCEAIRNNTSEKNLLPVVDDLGDDLDSL